MEIFYQDSQIYINKMKAADLPEVLAIQRKSFSEDLVESDEVIHDRFNKFGHHFYVAKAQESVIGYTLCFPWKLGSISEHNQLTPANLPEPDSFYLQDLSVSHNYRGRGISKLMLNVIYEHARELNFEYVSLVAVKQSGGYWDRQGFKAMDNLSHSQQLYLNYNYGSGARIMVLDIK